MRFLYLDMWVNYIHGWFSLICHFRISRPHFFNAIIITYDKVWVKLSYNFMVVSTYYISSHFSNCKFTLLKPKQATETNKYDNNNSIIFWIILTYINSRILACFRLFQKPTILKKVLKHFVLTNVKCHPYHTHPLPRAMLRNTNTSAACQSVSTLIMGKRWRKKWNS